MSTTAKKPPPFEPVLPISSELPHGGYKQSGYGKDMSIYSMEEYTQIKHAAFKID